MLDGDDWWTRDKLRIVLDTFEKNPGVGIVGHGCQITDSNGTVQRLVLPDQTYRTNLDTLESARLFDRVKGYLGTSKVAYRRSVLEKILPLPEELVFEADEYLWSVGAALTDVMVLDQALFFYRFHDSNFFMGSQDSDTVAARRYRVMSCLWRELPPRLAALGISPEIAEAALFSLKLDVEMLRLRVEGGWSWEMYRVERATARYSYSSAGPGYHAFKTFSLALALVLPPKTYCRLKRWYSARGLRRYRSALGEPTLAGPTAERRAAL